MQILLKLTKFKSVKDFQLSSEQQSTIQRREANNKSLSQWFLAPFSPPLGYASAASHNSAISPTLVMPEPGLAKIGG